jgi:hypothetical protein
LRRSGGLIYLTVVVVVTHSWFLVARSVYGLVDDSTIPVVSREVTLSVNCLVDTDRLFVIRAVARSVDGSTGHTNFLTIVGLESRSIFPLSDIDGAAVVAIIATHLVSILLL